MSAAVPMAKVAPVIGIFFSKPPIFQMFCSWWQAKMTAPAPRKSSALNHAWVKRWNMPASPETRPTAMTM
jgi:hypothetical protein